MEAIAKILVRHIMFILMSFTFFYIVAVTFTAPLNFTTWGLDGRVIFACIAHAAALVLHGYFIDRS